MTTITHVAVLFDGMVFSLPEPYRHHHVLRMMEHNKYAKRYNEGKYPVEVQGFVASDGMFLDRLDALDVFKNARQKWYDLCEHPSGLYSENCWDTPGKWNGAPGSPERQLWEYNEDPHVIESKLEVVPFTASIKPYRAPILIADFFHIEGVGIEIKNPFNNDRISNILYSELFKQPMDDEMTVNDLKVRIEAWKSNWIQDGDRI